MSTVEAYLAALPDDRREALTALRRTINAHLPEGYEEGIQYGMPAWFVPHSVCPDGYHCDASQPVPFVSIASQKRHIGLYLFCMYVDTDAQAEFVRRWKATGKRLDMGKSCIRVKKLDDVPLDLLGEFIAEQSVDRFLDRYEANVPAAKAKKRAWGKKV